MNNMNETVSTLIATLTSQLVEQVSEAVLARIDDDIASKLADNTVIIETARLLNQKDVRDIIKAYNDENDIASEMYVDDAISDLDIDDYATECYVDDAVNDIDLEDYATKSYVDEAVEDMDISGKVQSEMESTLYDYVTESDLEGQVEQIARYSTDIVTSDEIEEKMKEVIDTDDIVTCNDIIQVIADELCMSISNTDVSGDRLPSDAVQFAANVQHVMSEAMLQTTHDADMRSDAERELEQERANHAATMEKLNTVQSKQGEVIRKKVEVDKETGLIKETIIVEDDKLRSLVEELSGNVSDTVERMISHADSDNPVVNPSIIMDGVPAPEKTAD